MVNPVTFMRMTKTKFTEHSLHAVGQRLPQDLTGTRIPFPHAVLPRDIVRNHVETSVIHLGGDPSRAPTGTRRLGDSGLVTMPPTHSTSGTGLIIRKRVEHAVAVAIYRLAAEHTPLFQRNDVYPFHNYQDVAERIKQGEMFLQNLKNLESGVAKGLLSIVERAVQEQRALPKIFSDGRLDRSLDATWQGPSDAELKKLPRPVDLVQVKVDAPVFRVCLSGQIFYFHPLANQTLNLEQHSIQPIPGSVYFDAGKSEFTTNSSFNRSARCLWAAYKLSQRLGIHIVPECEYYEINGLKGILTKAAPGKTLPDDQTFRRSDYNLSSIQQAELFQFWIGDFNSHRGNFHIDDDGKIQIYDYDKAFEFGVPFLFNLWVAPNLKSSDQFYQHNPFGPILPFDYDSALVQRFKRYSPEKIERDMDGLASEAEIQGGLILRREILLSNAMDGIGQ